MGLKLKIKNQINPYFPLMGKEILMDYLGKLPNINLPEIYFFLDLNYALLKNECPCLKREIRENSQLKMEFSCSLIYSTSSS